VTAIPPSYREVIDPLIARAREFVEGGESLVPFAFVGNFTTRQIVPIHLDTGNEDVKDAAADAIRRAAAALQADFVFLVMESWGLPPDKIHRVDEIRERYGSIGESPYRIDMVSFSLETRHGLWFAQTPLKRKGASKKRRTFGLVEFRHYDDVDGRFADLLGTQPADTEGTGPLH
jgi:flavin-binding protein dodecin